MTCRPGIAWDQTHHTGCACYEKKRSEEMERLRAENARYRAALERIWTYSDTLGYCAIYDIAAGALAPRTEEKP